MKKVSSLPNLNRETTSFTNFITLFQHPADHHDDDDDTALQIHEHSCDTEASETSPFKAILSPSFSFDETNEIGFLAGTSSVGVFRSKSEHNDRTPSNSVSVGSNQFGGSEWSNLQTYIDNHSGIRVQSSESRTLQLKFLDKLSQPVRTNQMIKGEGNTPFRVALVDVDTKHVVTEASAKVEIVVVDGDFDGEHWTIEEFNQKIVREWEGKKSLLTGNVHLNLESGVGFIHEISFTHNSRWMKVCKLRLGAKVVDSFIGARIREAVTEPFVLKDYREIYSNKPSVPSLDDEVWRLKKIGRDGPLHNRLVRENIKTVKDFLTRFFIDPQSLRNIIGNAKTWEATVDHARKCVLDKRLHLYFPIDSEKKSGVVFNDVGQVVGLISECCYVPLDMLSEDRKAAAKKLVVSALEPTKEVKSFDDEICMHSYLQSLNDAYPSNSPRLESAGHYSCEASQTQILTP